MDAAEARAVLGLAASADADSVRAAFRGLVRRHHPDLAGATGAAATIRVLEAYRALQPDGPADRARLASPPRPRPPAPSRPPSAPAVPVWADGDTIVVARPTMDSWLALLEVAHGLGAVSYVDAGLGLLETIVEFVDFPVCSVLLTFRCPAQGTTEACCAVEALGLGDPPPAAAVAALIVDRLGAWLGVTPAGERQRS